MARFRPKRMTNLGSRQFFLQGDPCEANEPGRDYAKWLNLFGLPLSPVPSLDDAFGSFRNALEASSSKSWLATFANPLGLKLLQTDANYLAHLRRMDAVFCDGIGLALAARWLGDFPLERVSFDSTSLAPRVFAASRDLDKKIVIVGARPGIAEAAAQRIREAYPGICIVAALDGFVPQPELVQRVREIAPDIVICGMGAPRQEAFLVSLAESGWLGIGFTCGGYLDHLGARFDFYPKIIDRLNLRWLYRIFLEPRRIGYRFVVEYAPFWLALIRHSVTLTRYTHKSEDRL